ncbi:MAG: hypothetical protein AAGE65_05320 [Planctomycetota bacterium]
MTCEGLERCDKTTWPNRLPFAWNGLHPRLHIPNLSRLPFSEIDAAFKANIAMEGIKVAVLPD